jgi:hypothetical protein
MHRPPGFRGNIGYFMLKVSSIIFGIFLCLVFLLPGAIVTYPIYHLFDLTWELSTPVGFFISCIFYYWLFQDEPFSNQFNILINMLWKWWHDDYN